MKAKLFLAAGLSACVLLSGCGESAYESANKSAANVSESSVSKAPESSAVESAASSSDVSESTVSSVESSDAESSKEVSSSSKVQSIPKTNKWAEIKPDISEINPFRRETENILIDITNINTSESIPRVHVFHSDSPNEIGEDIGTAVNMDGVSYQIIGFPEGGAYYRVQGFNDDGDETQISDAFYYEFYVNPPQQAPNGGLPSNVQKHEISFYTMNGAVNGSQFEIFEAVPDYSQVDSLLSQGIQPDTIDVDIYLNCPYCGTQSYCGTYSYSYNESEANPVSLKCDNRNCQLHRKPSGQFICSHID